MAWPTDGVDQATTRSNGEIADADDFNDQDSQIRDIQGWLGDGDAELIGDDGAAAHGPSGLASPVADGGTAVKLAAKGDFTSGKLFSVGDNNDASYSEKASIDYAGRFTSEGFGVTADGALANPGHRDAVQTVTSSSGSISVDCRDGFVVYHELTEDTEVQAPTNPENGAELTFIIKGAGYDIDFAKGSKDFWFESAFPMAVAASEHVVVKFIYESSLGAWIEEWSNLVTTGIT